MRNRQRYGKDWPQKSRECKERAGWQCEECYTPHGTLRTSKWTGKAWPVYLQAAHKHHDPHNPDAELVAVCPRCHWHFYRRPGQPAVWMIERIKHRCLLEKERQ